jgi:hypothetical protein
MDILPRIIRHRDAPKYLGVNTNYFNKNIRPYLTEVEFGPQMIAFDRCELDEWFDNYKASNGRPGKGKEAKEPCRQTTKKSRVSTKGEKSGTSTKRSWEKELSQVLDQRITRKR